MTGPLFLAIAELSLYIAYLDDWHARHRIWPWDTALIGHPVILADSLTAATSPIAAFTGLSIGLFVLKMTHQQADTQNQDLDKTAHQPGTVAVASWLRNSITKLFDSPRTGPVTGGKL